MRQTGGTGRFVHIVKLSVLFSACLSSAGHSQKSPSFPSREAICSPVYGVSETGSVPYCSPRFGQCLKAEGDAITRLTQSWATIPKKIRDKCQAEARSRRSSIYQTYPSALTFARDQGYEGSYSVAAVEACIATSLKQAAPPKIDPLLPVCTPSGTDLPSDEAQTPAEQCASPNSFAQPDLYNACVKAQAAAKSGMANIKPMLTSQIVTSCVRLITAKGFDGNALPYRSSAFLACATKALKYSKLAE